MKYNHHILVMIFIASFFFINSTEGASREDEIYEEVKKAFGHEGKLKLGPISSADFDLDDIPSIDEAKEASSTILDKAHEALGPISPAAIEDAKDAFGPASAKAKEALGPVSPAALEEAKEALGPASAKAKEALGPSSSGVIDKAKQQLDSIASWITQNKEEIPSETENEHMPAEAPGPSPLDPHGILDGAKAKFDSLLNSITQEKAQISVSPSSDIAQKESSLSPSIDIEKNKARKMGPVLSDLDSKSPGSSPGPASSKGSDLSKMLDKAKNKFKKYISPNKLQVTPGQAAKHPSTYNYLDHDAVLAIEAAIKQAQTNVQLAIGEAKTLSGDPDVDSPDSGGCVTKCVSYYEASNKKLEKAIVDVNASNEELLVGDIVVAEGQIIKCQKCFTEQIKSPFTDLDEATLKAIHEGLNIINNSSD